MQSFILTLSISLTDSSKNKSQLLSRLLWRSSGVLKRVWGCRKNVWTTSYVGSSRSKTNVVVLGLKIPQRLLSRSSVFVFQPSISFCAVFDVMDRLDNGRCVQPRAVLGSMIRISSGMSYNMVSILSLECKSSSSDEREGMHWYAYFIVYNASNLLGQIEQGQYRFVLLHDDCTPSNGIGIGCHS
jgi:hypothetical protein